MRPPRVAAGLILISLNFFHNSYAADAPDVDASTIMQKMFETKRVDDQISTLSFRFIAPDKPEKQAVYIMVWKNTHGENDYDNKAIFFTENPPDKKGIAYLGWLRPAGSDKLDDEWIYLPELRMTRRIVQRDHDHSHDDDEFGNSLLTREHLDPRPPHLDEHKIIDEQLYNGQVHYLISSTPKHHQHMQSRGNESHETSAKRINWIDKNSLRLNRIQFFDGHDKELLDMQIQWQELQGYWIWKSIEATNPETLEETQLEISDIKINSNLKDRLFHKRSLEKGLSIIK